MRTNEEILKATGGYHQGTQTNVIGPEMRQMFEAGLIGESGGLTRKGSILAERLQNAQLEDLFG
jgi:hypothetical protein